MKDIRIICNVLEIYKRIKYPDFQAMTGVNSLRLHLYAWLIELGIIPVISTQFEERDQIIFPWSNLTGHEILVKMGVNSLRLHLYACLYIVWLPGQIWWS